MMTKSERHPGRSALVTALITLALLALLLAGCIRSAPARFYQLSPFPNGAVMAGAACPAKDRAIAIGPVRMPDYLDRPQIVTRSGDNEVVLSELNRWAGSLENDVARVLVENISAMPAADGCEVVRWTPAPVNRSATYGVEVSLERFEGARGDAVLLEARWVVSAPDRSVLLRSRSRIREPMQDDSYDAVVAAMSRALEVLSRDIAGGIRSALDDSGRATDGGEIAGP